MRPEVRNTLILVLVFAALLAGWWLLETFKPGQPPEETVEAARYLFPTLAVEDVQGLEVKLRSGQSVYVFKGPSAWYLGGMGGERLDENAVTGGIGDIVELRAQRTFTEGVSLAEFGLDAPTATLKLTLTDNRLESLLVGGTNPEKTSYYAQRAGDPAVYLASKYAIDAVLSWVSEPPLEPTPTPAAIQTVVVTPTPTMGPTTAVTVTVVATPTPTPTATATPAGAIITVVVTATPAPSATPVVTPTVVLTPTATTKP